MTVSVVFKRCFAEENILLFIKAQFAFLKNICSLPVYPYCVVYAILLLISRF